MNYDSENHIIEYIEGKKVKQFKVPKNDYNLDFNKMSYNDILTYIKLVQEAEQEDKTKNMIKYKPLKTVAAKTKDYFDRNEKLMSQVERQQKIAEFIISDKPENVTEILQDDTNYNNPFIKSLISSLLTYSNSFDILLIDVLPSSLIFTPSNRLSRASIVFSYSLVSLK